MPDTTVTEEKKTLFSGSSPILNRAAHVRLSLARRNLDHPERIDAELPNLMHTQSQLSQQDSIEATYFLIHYVKALSPYLLQRGYDMLLLKWCDGGLRECERFRRNPGWLRLLRGNAQYNLGEWNEAESELQTALKLSEDTDRQTYTRALVALGHLQFSRGDYVAALKTLDKAKLLLIKHLGFEQLDIIEQLGIIHVIITKYHLQRGDLDKALSLCLEDNAEITDVADRLLMLGMIYREKKAYEMAIKCLQNALHIINSMESSRSKAVTAMHHLAWVFLDLGDVDSARSWFMQAQAKGVFLEGKKFHS
ncbi:MAG TPA: tetratricopeptide repeat protein, partial [Methylomirabilota bacterium]|nr:tetratricopeptide repeat protein [Methylomirabilota bacterium]